MSLESGGTREAMEPELAKVPNQVLGERSFDCYSCKMLKHASMAIY